MQDTVETTVPRGGPTRFSRRHDVDWKKFLSREFLVSLGLIVVATIGLFMLDKVGFTEWAAACGGFVGIWTAGLTVQKLKGVATGGR